MRLLHETEMLRLRACRHGVFAYPKADRHIGRSLDLYGEWVESELELLSALVPVGGLVVDVGANLGTHTIGLARRVGPTGAVLAFEPQRYLSQLLVTSVTLNDLGWVRVIHGAVGASPGTVVVPDIDYAQPGSYGALALGSWEQGEKVAVFTIDGLELGRCSLLKVDVEGMELAVLEGAKKTLARLRPIVFVENNHAEGAPEVVQLLQGAGYALGWFFSPFFRKDNFAASTEDVFGGTVDANMVGVPLADAAVLRSLVPVEGPRDTAKAALGRLGRTQ